MSKYIYTEKMDEISGFGGGYEDICRQLVIAGLEWFDQNPDKKPVFKGLRGVFGLLLEDNQDAIDMCKYMTEKAGDDLTGAMMHAAHDHIRFVRQNGWDKYVEEMEKRYDEKGNLVK